MGNLELTLKQFELSSFSDLEQEEKLRSFLSKCFFSGIEGGIDHHFRQKEKMTSDDPRFILEIGAQLHAMGYQFEEDLKQSE